MKQHQYSPYTRLIHSIPVDEATGAISVPIYQTSTFVQQAPGVHKGYDYARSNNPTRAALENMIAQLEAGHAGFAFASGLAAIDAVVKLLQSGDEILAIEDIYGGAFRQFTHIWKKFGITVKYVDTADEEEVFKNLSPRTRLIWIESPSNPTLRLSSIASMSRIAEAQGSLLCVDNTFASPFLQQPLLHGADIVIHSGTKYLGGHSDLIAGLVVVKDPLLAEQVKFIQNACGAILGPQDSWLLIRGMETLPLRMELHCRNAFQLARYLRTHPFVDRVYYPGLPEHAHHELIHLQSGGRGGGVVSFTLKEDTADAARHVVCQTQLFKLAESLGGIKSLCCHPASMTHKSIPAEKRKQSGVTESMIRLSAGLEEAADLVADIGQALDLAQAASADFLTGTISHQ